MKTRRLISLLLCMLFVAVCALSACGETEDTGSVPSSGTTSLEGNAGNSDVDPKYLDSIGRYWPTYSGSMKDGIIGDRREIRVLVYNNTIQATYYSEEIEPDMYNTTDATLNEAVRERNNVINEKLGITVKAVAVDDVTSHLNNALQANVGDFDIAMPFLTTAASMAQNGSFYDLRDFEEKGIIDLSAPWYDQNANEALSIQNRLYFTVSDMSIMQKINSCAMTYNPALIEQIRPGLDLFRTVIDGDWTFDLMMEIGKEFAGDADGNGELNYLDNWGFASGYNDAPYFYLASGEKFCTKDENDNPIIAIGGDRSLTVSQKILDALQDKTCFIHAQELTSQGVTDIWGTALAIFGEERAVFRISAFSAIKKLRAYDVDYQIVPMPKIDSEQSDYYTPAASGYGIVIPIYLSEEDAEYSAYMIDALSALGKQYIATAYYDQILKRKDGLSDEDKSVDMLDLIFDNIVYDVGYFYDFASLRLIHQTLMENNSSDIVSLLESIRGQAQQKIDEVIEKYEQ